jgi:hypothetical protein
LRQRAGELSRPRSTLLLEKIMIKSNDSSKPGHAKLENGVLADSELAAVTGGIFREPTYHPAKVTVPDIKLSIS